MTKKYVLAIDQSTQGTKAIIFDRKRNLVARADVAHRQIVNEKGWVSHDLEEIYQNIMKAVKCAVEKTGIDKSEIGVIGISNQRETAAAWDKKTGKALAHAIVWQCARAENICERIKKNVVLSSDVSLAEEVRLRTGMQLSAYFSAAKFAWLQENEQTVKEAKCEGRLCFGTIDAWLIYRLTGGKTYASDYSNASRTQLFNINTLAWDEDVLSWFGITKECLPKVKDSNGFYGETTLEGFFDTPIPIHGVIGDSQSALYGQGCVKRGMMKATYGTGSSVAMNIGDKPAFSDQGIVTSLAWGVDGKVTYVFEGNINYSGAVITWLKDDMELIESAKETEELAKHANPADTSYMIPGFSGLGAPYWKPDAKAIIYGMSRTTGKKEIVRAALESIAYQITDTVEIMKSEDGIEISTISVDGGPTGNGYLMQFQSDIAQCTVRLSRCEESSALGAALLAGDAVGIFEKEDQSSSGKIYHPEMTVAERERKYLGWKQALEKVL